MKSVAQVINDTAIKNAAGNHEIGEIRDLKNPLSLRFHKSRERGTWCYLYRANNRLQRHRIGYWPVLKAKEVIGMLPGIIAKLGQGDELQSSAFRTVGDVLNWYTARTEKEALKSDSRKKGVLSAIRRHLAPLVGKVVVSDITKAVIDESLILPLQSQSLKPSTIRQYFAILKRVFTSAQALGLITVNPMAQMKFRDHVQRKIEPKSGRILVSDVPRVITQIELAPDTCRIMLLFMLMYGTRIGETRQLRWRHIDFTAGQMVIPEELTKTGVVHTLPLTGHSSSLLKQYRQQQPKDYLFGGSAPLSASESDRLVRTASERKWSAHDLRKAARSAWATIGIDYWVSERLLNHKQKGLDLVYINADSMAVKKAALEQYHTWLFGDLKTCHIRDMGILEISENASVFNKVA